ncbi:MAG: short-chain dehydrogenase [Planctomycetaceae bacterium]|nr:MAG: short-chain dehydrogenase [Planctomycetaceae bacterium]
MSQAGLGRVAVVTGGESGIGRATALRLIQEGWKVVVGDIVPRAENDQLYAELGIERCLCDVRVESQVQKLVSHAVAAGQGEIHLWVNNAGIVLVKPITHVSEEEWDRCLDINLKGAFFGCKHVIPVMQRQGGGVIVNVSSNAGLLPRVHDPVYCISKGALIALTKALALAHAHEKIRVNAVCPGPVDETEIIRHSLESAPDTEAQRRRLIEASPLAAAFGRMIHPDEVAAAILYFTSEAACMVTGTCLAIDGGKSLGVPATLLQSL